MNFQEPLKINSIDLTKIVYPKSRANNTKKIILIKLNEKNKLKNFVFQTPSLLYINRNNVSDNYSEIEVALEGKEKKSGSSQINKLGNFLNNLENKIKADAQYHGSLWFNMIEESQTINFQKVIRESSDYKNGTLKIKIIKNNDFETHIQLNNGKKINMNEIPDESWCKMILEVYAIWINSNNDFGIFLRPVVISFTPKEKEIYNYKFAEDSEEEHEFDIPDTEVTNNIFMKLPTNSKNNKINLGQDSTTQLDVANLINNLPNMSEMNNNILNLNLTSQVSSSESDKEINIKENSPNHISLEETDTDTDIDVDYESSSEDGNSSDK